MNLTNLDVKNEYRTQRNDIASEFYIPLLSNSILYKRAVGYFSSSSLVEISIGIAGLVKNGGKIQIVASPYLSEEDIEAIKKGYESREKVVESALLRELKDYEKHSYYEKERLNLLANLISDGILDIKIAFMDNENGIGMYHEKLGIIEDSEGNRVAFSGSMNESGPGMSCNYEAIDTFCSWSTPEILKRVEQKEEAFNRIWNDMEVGIKVLEFSKIKDQIIKRYKTKMPDLDIDKKEFCGSQYIIDETKSREVKEREIANNIPSLPKTVSLYAYQIEAIENWEKNNFRGIFDMATGTGKTYTGLAALCTLAKIKKNRLSVIIVCPYQHLVNQWVEDIEKFNIKPVIGYSSSPQKKWKKRLLDEITNQRFKVKDFICFICTNATFKSTYVQKCIDKIKTDILLLVDEAHNVGAKTFAEILDDRFKYRLGLSATLERHNDEEGTENLYDFFGEKCIEYSLERAIEEGKLTPYEYYPVVCYLTNEELDEYRKISMEITRCLISDSNGKLSLNERGKMLAIQRSRIVAGASQKLVELRRVMKDYVKDHNMLVYCGATNVIDEQSDYMPADESDIRQIEAVINILGNEFKMLVAKFTSEETSEERAKIIAQFEKGDRLQALVAIKCLDEGVNIPGISTAFILASTNNPKEYIQRRGRVLRKAKGKKRAVIYDFITLPRELDSISSLTNEQVSGDLTLVKNEIKRIKEFARISENVMDGMKLVYKLEDAYKLFIMTEEEMEYE